MRRAGHDGQAGATRALGRGCRSSAGWSSRANQGGLGLAGWDVDGQSLFSRRRCRVPTLRYPVTREICTQMQNHTAGIAIAILLKASAPALARTRGRIFVITRQAGAASLRLPR